MSKHQIDRETVMRLAQESILGTSNDGLCTSCGHIQSGVEPDARGYECECCGERAVYGAEWLLFTL